jgi:hypothetical protein
MEFKYKNILLLMAKAIDISKRMVEFKTKIECLSDEWWISEFNDYDKEIDGIIIKILIYI